MWYVFRYVNVLFVKKKNECRIIGVYPSVKAFNNATTLKNSANSFKNCKLDFELKPKPYVVL